MIRIVDGKLKGPSRMALCGYVFNLSPGDGIHQMYRSWKGDLPGDRIIDSLVYRANGGSVIVSADDSQHGVLIHTSIAFNDHDPDWETIKALKEEVFGDTEVMMVLPKKENYINVHKHAFHLWQMPAEWGIS